MSYAHPLDIEIARRHMAWRKKCPYVPMELWEPTDHAKYYLVKERRQKKLRSRNGRCLTCKLLIMECRCLATIAEYESIEAGKIHLTRNRLDAAMDRALDRDVEIWHKAIDAFFEDLIAEMFEDYHGEF